MITDDLETEIPEDGVYEQCYRLVRGHAGVKRVLKARGITRSVPYCRCPERSAPADPETPPENRKLL